MPELREINFGSATGKSKEWFNANKTPLAPGSSALYHRWLPDAESDKDVYDRVSKFVGFLEATGDEQVIVVGHGGSLQMFTLSWLGIPTETLKHINFFGSAGGVSFFREDEYKSKAVLKWNDTSYIDAL